MAATVRAADVRDPLRIWPPCPSWRVSLHIGANEVFGVVEICREVSVIGIAVSQMTEGREDVIAVVLSHGA